MPLILSRAPTVEPVALAEALIHCRLAASDDDGSLSRLITVARREIEATLGVGLVTQEWTWRLDRWPAGRRLRLPLRPVTKLTALRVADAEGVLQAIDIATMKLDMVDDGGGVLTTRDGCPWPEPGGADCGIEIAFDVGYGTTADAVPAPIRQALVMLVARSFENREPAQGADFPGEVARLLAPYRMMRL